MQTYVHDVLMALHIVWEVDDAVWWGCGGDVYELEAAAKHHESIESLIGEGLGFSIIGIPISNVVVS